MSGRPEFPANTALIVKPNGISGLHQKLLCVMPAARLYSEAAACFIRGNRSKILRERLKKMNMATMKILDA